jgi:hypothetical protein
LRFELLRFYTARVTLRLPGSIGRCLLCPAIPEARDGTPKACQLTTLTAKPAAFSTTLAQSGPPRTFWRTGDDGVDLFGIERAVDHQRFGDGETTALWDQRAEDQDAKHALMRMEAAWRTPANQQEILDCKQWKKPAG